MKKLLNKYFPAYQRRYVLRQIRLFFTNKKKNELKRDIKYGVEWFFEGIADYSFGDYGHTDMLFEPVAMSPCSVHFLGISSIKYKFSQDTVTVQFTLKRPGVFIGKGGSNIKSLETHLSEIIEKNVKILVKKTNDRNLWGIV